MLAAVLLLAAAPKIAVLDVRLGPGVDAALGPYLAQVLAQEVADRTGATPLVSADVTAMLGFERNKRLLGCSEEESSCLAEITGALGVSEVLAPSLSVAGGRYLFTLSLLDARHGVPIKRSAQSVERDDEALLQTARRGAWQIFGGAEPGRPAAPEASVRFRLPSRRTWALVAAGGAVALAATGAIVGANALSAAHDGNSAAAKPRAHIADILFGAALVAAGAGAYLWFSAAPAQPAVGVAGTW